jgi:hypothetical protein
MILPKTVKTVLIVTLSTLSLMVAKEDWGSEDMTAVNAAISAGNGYTAS